jgi:hypothetical protein
MSTLEVVQNGGAHVLLAIFSINMSSIITKFKQQGQKKTMQKSKKNKEMSNFGP